MADFAVWDRVSLDQFPSVAFGDIKPFAQFGSKYSEILWTGALVSTGTRGCDTLARGA